jgi:hypothetical protein
MAAGKYQAMRLGKSNARRLDSEPTKHSTNRNVNQMGTERISNDKSAYRK